MAKRTGKEPKLLPAGRLKAGGRLMLDSMAEAMASAIEAGGAQPGDLLPPERTLAARHRIGRITVRSALRKLVAEWKQVAPNFYGDYWPLTQWRAEADAWLAWQFDRPEAGEGEAVSCGTATRRATTAPGSRRPFRM